MNFGDIDKAAESYLDTYLMLLGMANNKTDRGEPEGEKERSALLQNGPGKAYNNLIAARHKYHTAMNRLNVVITKDKDGVTRWLAWSWSDEYQYGGIVTYSSDDAGGYGIGGVGIKMVKKIYLMMIRD